MGTGTEGIEEKESKHVVDRRTECKKDGAEDPPWAATFPKIIRNCFTYRHDSMFATKLCDSVGLLIIK
jgi:hypothetical protein